MPRTAPATVRDALTDYRAVKRGQYSTNTWEAHEGALSRWETWLYLDIQPNVYLTDVDDRHMVRYFDRLRPPAFAPSTFNNYRQYLCAFWNYCREEGWVHANPMRHVRPMTVPRRVRLQLSATELQMMLDGADPRDRVGLALGMNTGLRGGDIAALTVSSPDFTTSRLTAWVEKTDEEIVLPMTSDLRDELLSWLDYYATYHGLTVAQLPNDWTLMPPAQGVSFNVNNPELGRRVIYKPHQRFKHPEVIVHRALARLGYPTHKEGFHTLRRSAARVVFEAAKAAGDPDPIAIPQTLLNHKSRRTTELYLGVSVEKSRLDDMLRGKSFLADAIARDRAAIEGDADVDRVLRRA